MYSKEKNYETILAIILGLMVIFVITEIKGLAVASVILALVALIFSDHHELDNMGMVEVITCAGICDVEGAPFSHLFPDIVSYIDYGPAFKKG